MHGLRREMMRCGPGMTLCRNKAMLVATGKRHSERGTALAGTSERNSGRKKPLFETSERIVGTTMTNSRGRKSPDDGASRHPRRYAASSVTRRRLRGPRGRRAARSSPRAPGKPPSLATLPLPYGDSVPWCSRCSWVSGHSGSAILRRWTNGSADQPASVGSSWSERVSRRNSGRPPSDGVA